ncbi:glyoxylate/hydroxypyruvate reductase HPR3-like, partial [Morus notabilis]
CIVRYPRSQKVTSRIGKFQFGGKRIGIVGFGKIGSEVAKRLEAFGCNVLYNSRNEMPSISYPFYSTIRDLAENSDAIVLCCSLTTETRQIVGKEVLSALGKNGVIVNVGRGALIDEKELVRCLVAREIGGAGLDVFENEPNVPEELFALDNVVLSPHVSAYTPESFEAAAEFAIANLEAFFSNKPLLSPITID